MSTITAESSVRIAIDVKCEKCGHEYTIEKTLTEQVSRGGFSNSFMQGFKGEGIGDTATRGLHRRIAAISEGTSLDLVDKPCPNCKYLQSWMCGARAYHWGCAVSITCMVAAFVLLSSVIKTPWINLIVSGIIAVTVLAVAGEGLKRVFSGGKSRQKYPTRTPTIRYL